MFSFLRNIGPTEIVLIGVVLIALFGAKLMVSLGKQAGESVREIKKIKKSIDEPINELKSSKKEVSD